MKVRDLIEKLKNLDKDHEVFIKEIDVIFDIIDVKEKQHPMSEGNPAGGECACAMIYVGQEIRRGQSEEYDK